MAHLRSLRDYITALDEIGEIERIDTEVDWNQEVGAIIGRSYDLRAPLPLFTNITGYPDSGFRVIGAPGALSGPAHPLARIALSLGLPATATGQQIIEAVVAARGRPGIPPVTVPTNQAPCKQNVAHGADVGMYAFPSPLIHASDGRCIQTYGMNIVATPDGSWTNWSVSRVMIAGQGRLAWLIPPLQHVGIIRAQWAALGQPMPIVLALGAEPGLPFAGGMPLPHGADESHFLGALFGEPVEVTRAETVDLPVPATAEILIEGHIAVDETAMQEPVNECLGCDATKASPKAMFAVSAITWRDAAILPVVAAGPPAEGDLEDAWPHHIRQRVLDNWSAYGYR